MQYHHPSRYELEKLQLQYPGAYPYHPRYDELELLRAELDQEDRIRESLEWSNGEMERSIGELETHVRELDEGQKGIDDNEWKVRFESQVAMNKQLTEHKDWLETELAEARRKLTTGSYPEAMNFNLDALTEAELLRLVKHLERMRNDFYSTLRDTEWKLDKESKEFHHFDEMRRVYKSDQKHANAQIERLKLGGVLDPTTGLINPMYPPGYFRWLDTHTPAPGSKSTSKSPSRKGHHGSKGREDGRSPSRSPTRSKSRGGDHKKGGGKGSSRREEPPPSEEEEGTTPTKSEEVDQEDEEGYEEEEGGGGGGGGHQGRSPGRGGGGGGKSRSDRDEVAGPSSKMDGGGGSPSKGGKHSRDTSKERAERERGGGGSNVE